MRLVIISGRSGSGKTVALHALEDLGFYCIDNLPVSFLPELEDHIGNKHAVAISIDSRNIPSALDLQTVIQLLEKKMGKALEIVYLDADENTLLKRFSETKRKHPLSNQTTSLREAIQKEKDILAPLSHLATVSFNTAGLNYQALHNLIRDKIATHEVKKIQILVQSFGFKNGIPADADFIFDVRCLPNPYWQRNLRNYSGLDKAVVEYLAAIPEVKIMLKDIYAFLEKWIPSFQADKRCYLNISIGCTGGLHRSVYITEKLAELLSVKEMDTQIRHRDL
jgi:UPF0042 nucleotide-binding protein